MRRYRGSWREEERDRAREEFSGGRRVLTKRIAFDCAVIGCFGNGSEAGWHDCERRPTTSPPPTTTLSPPQQLAAAAHIMASQRVFQLGLRRAAAPSFRFQPAGRMVQRRYVARDTITSCSPHPHARPGSMKLTLQQTRKHPDYRKGQPGDWRGTPCEAAPAAPRLPASCHLPTANHLVRLGSQSCHRRHPQWRSLHLRHRIPRSAYARMAPREPISSRCGRRMATMG